MKISSILLFKKRAIGAVLCLTICTSVFCSKKKEIAPPVSPEEETLPPKLAGSFADKFLRLYPGQPFKGMPVTVWTDTCWKNDRMHKQLVVWSEKEVSSLSYQMNDLTNGNSVISANNIRLRFEKYAKGDELAMDCGKQSSRATALIPDILSPEIVQSVTPADPVKIWLTVDIPSTTTLGRYQGTLSISGADTTLNFQLDFLVAAHTLPAVADWKFHLDLWQFPFQLTDLIRSQGNPGIEPFSTEYFSLMAPFYKLLADAGQKNITAYIKDGAFKSGQTMVEWIKKADDNWAYDFTNFDRFVDSMMSWGISRQISCFSVAGWQNSVRYTDEASGTVQQLDLPIGSDIFKTTWQHFLTSFKNHLVSKGWFEKTVLYMDESPDESMTAIINTIKANDNNWKIGLAGSHASEQNESRLYDYSTIYGTARKYRPFVNTVSTFYTSCTQTIPNNYVSKQNSPAEMPWMAWYAQAGGFDGYLRWAFDYWTKLDVADIQDGANTAGDFNMIYRTSNTASSRPLSSIRFELLREGIQDFEKMRLLSNGDPYGSSTFQNILNQFRTSVGSDAAQLVSQGESIIKRASL